MRSTPSTLIVTLALWLVGLPACGSGDGPLAEGGPPEETGGGEGEGEGEGEGDLVCVDGYMVRPDAVDECAPMVVPAVCPSLETPCDLQGQPCEEPGQGCVQEQDNPGIYTCDVTPNPLPEGHACDEPTSCGDGMFCMNRGTCARMCETDEQCPGERRCNSGTANRNDARLTMICGDPPPQCTPLCGARQCGEGQGCYRTIGFQWVCTTPASGAGALGESCGIRLGTVDGYKPTKCQIGLVCETTSRTCRRPCDLDAKDPEEGCEADQSCVSVNSAALSNLGVCQ